MKLEKQFVSKDNKLYMLDGTEVPVVNASVLEAKFCVNEASAQNVNVFACIELPWTQIGCDEESYNEEFLARFRDFLKALDEKKVFAFIVPVADKIPSSEDEKDAFVASFKHCARRIKDCVSVAGFAVPSLETGIDSSFFMEELSQKHEHYVFFSKDGNVLSDSSVVKF